MKKYMLVFVFALSTTFAKASGFNYQYLNFYAGHTIQRGIDFNFSYERELRYNHSYELFANYYNQYKDHSFWKYNRSLMVGAAYKPALVRCKNSIFRFRIGGGIGSNFNAFTMKADLGFEYEIEFKNEVKFFISQRNDFVFWGKDHFRNGLTVGFKIPIN